MKRGILVALVVVMVCWAASGQSCLPSGIVVSTQAQIDNFPANYPGCTEIEGTLWINGDVVVNLDSLKALNRIGGSLLVTNCRNLPNLDGLNQLTSIGGNLEVRENAGFAIFSSLFGLNALTEIGGNLRIEYNSLPSLAGLDQLTSIGGDMIVIDGISDFTGLNNLSFIGGNFEIASTPSLTSLAGLNQLTTIEGDLKINDGSLLNDLTGLNNLNSLGGSLEVSWSDLNSFNGLENLDTIGGSIDISFNYALTTFQGLSNLTHIGSYFAIHDSPLLINLNGLENLKTINSLLSLWSLPGLINLEGLNNLETLGGLIIDENNALTNLTGLENLTSIQLDPIFQHPGIFLTNNPILEDVNALGNLEELRGSLVVADCPSLSSLQSLSMITSIEGDLHISNSGLTNFSGLDQLHSISDYLLIENNNQLTSLDGLNQLTSVRSYITIFGNPALTSLAGLEQLTSVPEEDIFISQNENLSECSTLPVCNILLHLPGYNIHISNNAPGCNSIEEVEMECNGQPVSVSVLTDTNNNCQMDADDIPVVAAFVSLNGNLQSATRPANDEGIAKFGYLDNGPFFLHLPQFPTQHWSACQDTVWVDPNNFADTIRADLFLQPLTQCPDLFVNLQLPFRFRGCLVASDVQVKIQNVGTITAEDILATVVLPISVLEIMTTSLPISAQNGDTLFFAIENLAPFETAQINLVVRTRCDTFLLNQTLCLEAFATPSNACPATQNFSEVRLYSECLNDETVRFTLKNIGNAPTQSMHEYVIIEDEVILMMDDFTLIPHEERTLDLPATGATYRMEATRFDNGVQTAIALENCGGLTPGLITAYWLDEGLNNYDYACAEVIVAYDPNQKTAIPKGVGESHLTAANRPFQYTIEFQNTGTDTAFRVLLTDILSPHLDVNTFRPGFSSHPYSWEIRGLDTLNVLFFPIELPDSNVDVAGSQGFFTFDIDQKPDLPDGTVIENTASIVFDFNPPIVTNTVFHTIGELVVNIDEPERGANPMWKVFANPVKASATFQAIGVLAGEKRFDLYDAAGRKVRAERFYGQEFLFQRAGLAGGLYFFRITDEQGKSASGKIIIAD